MCAVGAPKHNGVVANKTALPSPPPSARFTGRTRGWMVELLSDDGFSLAQFCDNEGLMLHKTWTAVKNFLAKAERNGYQIDFDAQPTLYIERTYRVVRHDSEWGKAVDAVWRWAHRPGWQVPYAFARNAALRMERELSPSQMNTVIELLPDYEGTPNELDDLVQVVRNITP